jgi:hypothetical protein
VDSRNGDSMKAIQLETENDGKIGMDISSQHLPHLM